MEKILDCPICGGKTVVDCAKPDGFFMGWSIGCPRYRLNDGIHIKRMAFHNISTKDKAIEIWNKYVSGIDYKRKNNGKEQQTY